MYLIKDQNQIKEFIDELLTKRESEDLEFKQASGGFPGNFWDTYSAFANTEGGTIIFGVVEKEDGFYLDMLSDELIEKYALNIHKADIYTMLKDMCNMQFLIAEGYGRGTKYCIPGMNSNLGSNLGSNPKKKRMSRRELRKEIVNICSDWVSLDYISITIGRNADYLLSDVIPSMLEEGLIERMYPQTPRHPNQKYRKKG